MPITLKGLPFDMKIISELEKNLLSKKYDLSEFSFIKTTRHNPMPYGYPLNIEYDYTVWVGEKHFSIVFSDDVQFARFLYRLCCDSAEDGSLTHVGNLLDRVIQKLKNCIEATKRWFTEYPFHKDNK
jgi:hypothetical protein